MSHPLVDVHELDNVRMRKRNQGYSSEDDREGAREYTRGEVVSDYRRSGNVKKWDGAKYEKKK